jgi:hypothetical protein
MVQFVGKNMHLNRARSGNETQEQRNPNNTRSKSQVTTSNINRVTSPAPSYNRTNLQRSVPGVNYPINSMTKDFGIYRSDNPTNYNIFQMQMQELFKLAVESQEVRTELTGIEVSDIKYEDFQKAIEQLFASKSNGQVGENEEIKQTQSRVNNETSAENRMILIPWIIYDSDERFDFVYATLQCLSYSRNFIDALQGLNEAEYLKRIFHKDTGKSALINYIYKFCQRNPSIKDAGMFLQLMLGEVLQLREIFWIKAKMQGTCRYKDCKRDNIINTPNSLLSLTVQTGRDSSIEQILQRNRELNADCEFCRRKVLFMAEYDPPFPEILVIKLDGQFRFRTQVKLRPTLNWNYERYSLISICCHRQESRFAYYYSICKTSQKWYRILDGERRQISFKDVESNIDSYIIFYERED